jgi:hypothetical protein
MQSLAFGELLKTLYNGGKKMRSINIFGLIGFAGAVLIIALLAQGYGVLPDFRNSGGSASGSGGAGLLPNATDVQFTAWELSTWVGLKNRLVVNNTDPLFTGERTLQWISMRNSSSGDYYQKSMEWLCFWEGQGAAGEWEAVVSIYNSPNSTSVFVVEVSRFTWHSLNVLLDGSVVASFPQVTNDTVSVGYATFEVVV